MHTDVVSTTKELSVKIKPLFSLIIDSFNCICLPVVVTRGRAIVFSTMAFARIVLLACLFYSISHHIHCWNDGPRLIKRSNSTKPCGDKQFGSSGIIRLSDWKPHLITQCRWKIEVPLHHRILIQAVHVKLPNTSKDSRCHHRLKIFTNAYKLPIRVFTVCGRNFKSQLVESTMALLKYEATSKHATKKSDFLISWTAISKSDDCRGFVCAVNNYCINSSDVCNGYPNCGDNDRSDENCPSVSLAESFWEENWNIFVPAVVVLGVIAIGVVSYYCRYRAAHGSASLDNSSTKYMGAMIERKTDDPLPPLPDGNVQWSYDDKGKHFIAVFGPPPPYPGTPGQVVFRAHPDVWRKASLHSSASSSRSLRSKSSGHRNNKVIWTDSSNDTDASAFSSVSETVRCKRHHRRRECRHRQQRACTCNRVRSSQEIIPTGYLSEGDGRRYHRGSSASRGYRSDDGGSHHHRHQHKSLKQTHKLNAQSMEAVLF